VYIWSIGAGLGEIAEEYVSPQIEDVLGFGPDEWIGSPRLWIDQLHPEDRDEVLGETARSVAAGEPFKLEYRMLARDGRVVWLHDVASVLTRDDRGRATRYQGVQLDITARKEAEHAQRQAFQRLRLLDEQRRELLDRVVTAQEEERRRIAAGIHDDTIQALGVALLRLQTIAEGPVDDEKLEALLRVVSEVSEAIVRLRQLAFELHPRIQDVDGLKAALQLHLERCASSRAALAYRLDDRLSRQPSSETGAILYRIAQEALTNACKHGEASNIVVALENWADGVLIRIKDDGIGFQAERVLQSAPEHVGLISMKERAEAAGGWWKIESTPGNGTKVEFWVPDALPAGSDERERRRPSAAIAGSAEAEAKTSPSESASDPAQLSPRELEVAKLLALGHTNVEIAKILHLSVRTVEHHRSRVFRKLRVHSRAGLVQALR
jgi:PAS domain S-box-containing protein